MSEQAIVNMFLNRKAAKLSDEEAQAQTLNWALGHPQIDNATAQQLVPNLRTRQGTLYKVDVPDEAVAKMLRWDQPLSQQQQPVKDLANSMMAPHVTTEPLGPGLVDVKVGGGTVGAFAPDRAAQVAENPADYVPMTWQDLYQLLGMNESKSSASGKLLAQGIPGIRYLDQGSRGAVGGTYNTVLFDDSLAKILGRE